MKILHCFGKMDVGGAETMMMNVYRKINKDKYSFDFLVFNNSPGVYDKEINNMGGKIFYLPSLGEVGPISFVKNIKNFLKKHPYDAVHSHIDWQGGYIVFAAFLANVKKRIVHSHAIQENFATDLVHSIAIKFAKVLIEIFATEKCACSKDAYKSLFLSKRHSVIIKNGIDLDKYIHVDNQQVDILKNKLGVKQNEIILGHIGSFSENKNQNFLIELLKLISEDKKVYKLLLIGTGSTLENVKANAQKLGVEDKVMFLGLQKDIPLFASMFDYFLFPSIYEGLGIVGIEAQALGIPCIVSDSVPKEIDLGLDLVEFVSLDDIKEWERKILCGKEKCRDIKIIKKKFEEKGYDILHSVKQIENVYG